MKWDHKEGWVLKNWCFQTGVLEKILESSLDCKIRSVNPKGNKLWILTGRTDAEAEAPREEPTHWKRPDAGKDWRQKEKRAAEDEMAGWHHQFNGHELQQTPEDSRGQGGLVCCSPVVKNWTQFSDWTTMKIYRPYLDLGLNMQIFNKIFEIARKFEHQLPTWYD